MIGGGMLACAVGAMILIAWWSLNNDDSQGEVTGIMALRSWSERLVARKHERGGRRNRRPEPGTVKANGKRDRRPDPSKRRRLH